MEKNLENVGSYCMRESYGKNERKDLSELRKITNAVWERDMVSEGE